MEVEQLIQQHEQWLEAAAVTSLARRQGAAAPLPARRRQTALKRRLLSWSLGYLLLLSGFTLAGWSLLQHLLDDAGAGAAVAVTLSEPLVEEASGLFQALGEVVPWAD